MVEDLPVGVRQRVEIIKTLYRQSNLLILDEPSAVLTPQETGELFEIMRSLQATGTSIIFITHKLNEVLEIADRITVLRRGKVVGSATPAGGDPAVAGPDDGRPSGRPRGGQGTATVGEPVLEIEGLTVDDDRGHAAVYGIDLIVRAGEIGSPACRATARPN